jgi:tRNA(fMet)-specific endonuclease VapC
MKYLVDTDWVIEYLKGREPVTQLLSDWVELGMAVSLITYGEVYEGIYFSQKPDRQKADFERFLQGVTLLSLTEEIMQHFARLRGQLRSSGQLIGDADLLIAATAIQHNLTLLTFNTRHFQRIPGLLLYDSRM